MKSVYQYIQEKLNGFNGQYEFILSIANFIDEQLKSNPNIKDFTFDKIFLDANDFNFLFFNKLVIIHADENKYNTYYTTYNEHNKIFDKIGININLKTYNTYNRLSKVLAHELMHAYEDFNRHINNKEILVQYFKRNDTDNKFNYAKTLKDDFKEYRTLLNNISKVEQNAYLNELTVELESSNFDIFNYKTFDEAFDAAVNIIFMNTNSAYKIYLDGLALLKNITEENKKHFTEVYNDINNSNLTFSKIYKKVSNTLSNIINKFEKEILLLFKDYYSEKINEIKGAN